MTSGGGADGLAVGAGSTAFVVPERELRWRFSRSSGPGGQGVNTTDSRAELSLDVTTLELPEGLHERLLRRLAPKLVDGVLTVVAAEHRSQLRNRDAARHRMATLLTDALARLRRRGVPPARRSAPRPGGWTRRPTAARSNACAAAPTNSDPPTRTRTALVTLAQQPGPLCRTTRAVPSRGSSMPDSGRRSLP